MSADVRAVLAGERPWTIATGDSLTLLRSMPDACLHVCATSPPYFALRSYLENGHEHKSLEIGSEPTPEEFVESLVNVFREVRRVLVPWGVCWVNMGDSFSSGDRAYYDVDKKLEARAISQRPATPPGFKPLDLLGIPFRLVEALRQDGWYHRDTVAWVKKAPMPSSVAGWRYERCRVKVGKTRTHNQSWSHGSSGSHGDNCGGLSNTPWAQWSDCPGCPKCEPNDGYVLRKGSWRHTSAWEPVFMLTPSPEYFCDQESVRVRNSNEATAVLEMSSPSANRLFLSEEGPEIPTPLLQGLREGEHVPLAKDGRGEGVYGGHSKEVRQKSKRKGKTASVQPVSEIEGDEEGLGEIGARQAETKGVQQEALAKAIPDEVCPIGQGPREDQREQQNTTQQGATGSVSPQTAVYVGRVRQHANAEGVGGDQDSSQAQVCLLPEETASNSGSRNPPVKGRASRKGKRGARLPAVQCEQGEQDSNALLGGANPRNVLHLGPSPQSFALCRACGEYHRNVNVLKKRNGKPRCPCGAQDFVAHYAAYPPQLVEPLLRASTSAEGCCPTCLMPWVRVVERTAMETRPGPRQDGHRTSGNGTAHSRTAISGTMLAPAESETLGWRPSCNCAAGPPIPMTILDPFAGTGTTLLVARRLGLRAIGLDLSPDYSALARARVLDDCPLFGG